MSRTQDQINAARVISGDICERSLRGLVWALVAVAGVVIALGLWLAGWV